MNVGELTQWLSLAIVFVGAAFSVVKTAISVSRSLISFSRSFDDYKSQSKITDESHRVMIDSMDKRISGQEQNFTDYKKQMHDDIRDLHAKIDRINNR